jgi:tryptophan synthase alpha chain
MAELEPHKRISAALRAPSSRGQLALVGFLTAGFPSRERFARDLVEIAEAADVVEIGVPFSDPMADGVTIQRASERALRAGVSLRWIIEQLEALPRQRTPLLLMSYFNPLLAHGLSRLVVDAARVGVCGFIVPDLPYDEGEELGRLCAQHGLALVQMVTPVTTPERLAKVAAASQGFVYAVTMTGTTGHSVSGSADLGSYLERVRAAASVPVCAGFGIRTREQVEALRGRADGVVVGSALVEVLESGASPAQFLRSLRG